MAEQVTEKYPPIRIYKCPKCKETVYTKRQGETLTYIVHDMDKNEPGSNHSCGYSGSINIK